MFEKTSQHAFETFRVCFVRLQSGALRKIGDARHQSAQQKSLREVFVFGRGSGPVDDTFARAAVSVLHILQINPYTYIIYRFAASGSALIIRRVIFQSCGKPEHQST